MLTQEQKQALFTRAVTKTIEQGRPCRSGAGGYSYQEMVDGEELRCAIGWLMDDDSPALTSNQWIGALVREGRVTQLAGITVVSDDEPFLGGLQRLHDAAAAGRRSDEAFLRTFVADARVFAAAQGLSVDGIPGISMTVRDVVEASESLSLDNEKDRETLIKRLEGVVQ